MAGIWNRIYDRGENDDPVPSLLVSAGVNLVVNGVFTATQVRDALNATLQTPFNTDELSDLNTIITNASSGDSRAKNTYAHLFLSLLMAVETHVLTNESTFRNKLGLP